MGILGALLFVAAPAGCGRAGRLGGTCRVPIRQDCRGGVGVGFLLVVTLFLALLLGRIGLVVTAVGAVLVLAGVRSRNKPSPPGPDGMRHEGGTPAGTAPPGGLGFCSKFHSCQPDGGGARL